MMVQAIHLELLHLVFDWHGHTPQNRWAVLQTASTILGVTRKTKNKPDFDSESSKLSYMPLRQERIALWEWKKRCGNRCQSGLVPNDLILFSCQPDATCFWSEIDIQMDRSNNILWQLEHSQLTSTKPHKERKIEFWNVIYFNEWFSWRFMYW